MSPHERLVSQCYEIAARAVAHGNHPFGALLSINGDVLLTAENTVVTLHDPTGHAELNLVRTAARTIGLDMMAQTTLYTSTEPCAMCAAAISWAGIRTVTYGCGGDTLEAIVDGHFYIPCREIFERMTSGVTVVGPVLESLGLEQHEAFWG